jgi:Zn finger protein HypA/HybF involved in hydrogenase expression
MMTFPQPNQADVDRAARELYQPFGKCYECRRAVTLAEALQFKCPHCGAVYLPGLITPERARVMLDTLKRRRAELGLAGEGA